MTICTFCWKFSITVVVESMFSDISLIALFLYYPIYAWTVFFLLSVKGEVEEKVKVGRALASCQAI